MQFNKSAIQHDTVNNAGFTLIELSVVITIIALVLGVALTGITTILESKKGTTTREKLVVIDKVIQTYLETNKYLPCPAPLSTTPFTDATFGKSKSSAGICSSGAGTGIFQPAGSDVLVGMVPVKSLGISETYAYDAWNQRLVYAVSKEHTEGGDYTNRDGAIIVKDSNGNNLIDTGSPYEARASYVVLSHGKNRMGGYSLRTAAQADTCALSSKDKENCSFQDASSPNGEFRDMGYSESDDVANYFDDSIVWRVKNLNISANGGKPVWVGVVSEHIDPLSYHDASGGIEPSGTTYGTQEGLDFTDQTSAGSYVNIFLAEHAPYGTADFVVTEPTSATANTLLSAPTGITKMEVVLKAELLGTKNHNGCEVHHRNIWTDFPSNDNYSNVATIVASIAYSPATVVAPGTGPATVPSSFFASTKTVISVPESESSGFRVWCRGGFRNMQLHIQAVECSESCSYEND